MSRAYRIRVQESLRKTIRAHDHVSTQLELLALLPPAELGELLGNELARHGFERQGACAVRTQDDTTVIVDLQTGTVSVRAVATEKLEETVEREGIADRENVQSQKQVEQQLRRALHDSLQQRVDQKKAELQTAVTDKLEAKLGDLRQELNEVVNRVTAEALKRKAAQLGTIKQVAEDAASGSMTIVLEV